MNINAETDGNGIKERKNATLEDGNTITISSNIKVQLIPKN